MTATVTPAAERTGAVRSTPAPTRRRRLPLLLLPLILLLLATGIGYLLLHDRQPGSTQNTSATGAAGTDALPPSQAPAAAAPGAAAPPVTGGGAAAAAPAAPDPSAVPATSVGLVGGGGMAPTPASGGLARENASGTILFATGSARLDPAAMQVVEDAATRLQAQQVSSVSVTGYTDDVGSIPLNVALSERRAVAVAAALDSMLPQGMVMSTGKGWSDPAAPNDTTENRMMNRRVTIVGS